MPTSADTVCTAVVVGGKCGEPQSSTTAFAATPHSQLKEGEETKPSESARGKVEYSRCMPQLVCMSALENPSRGRNGICTWREQLKKSAFAKEEEEQDNTSPLPLLHTHTHTYDMEILLLWPSLSSCPPNLTVALYLQAFG